MQNYIKYTNLQVITPNKQRLITKKLPQGTGNNRKLPESIQNYIKFKNLQEITTN